jgi:glycerol dehydrogenase
LHGNKRTINTVVQLKMENRMPQPPHVEQHYFLFSQMTVLQKIFMEVYMVDEVYTFCKQVGLPTTFADIGLAKASDDDLMKVAATTCAPGETIHNEPIPVTPLMVFSALKAADA